MLDLLARGGFDGQGQAIASRWVARSMKAVLSGKMLARMDDQGNLADTDKIANPDNLAYSNVLHTLFIGEDSAFHSNNYLWAFNFNYQSLERILSVPEGAEVAALHVSHKLQDRPVLIVGFQHAGAVSRSQKRLFPVLSEQVSQRWSGGRRAVVGYISGL